MRGYKINSINSLFLKNAETEELDKEVKFNFNKTFYTAVGGYFIYMIIAYLNVLIIKVLTHKMVININVF
jgi:hypothetical protein